MCWDVCPQCRQLINEKEKKTWLLIIFVSLWLINALCSLTKVVLGLYGCVLPAVGVCPSVRLPTYVNQYLLNACYQRHQTYTWARIMFLSDYLGHFFKVIFWYLDEGVFKETLKTGMCSRIEKSGGFLIDLHMSVSQIFTQAYQSLMFSALYVNHWTPGELSVHNDPSSSLTVSWHCHEGHAYLFIFTAVNVAKFHGLPLLAAIWNYVEFCL